MRQTNFFADQEDEQELLTQILDTTDLPAGFQAVILDPHGARSDSQIRVYRKACEVPAVGADRQHELLYPALQGDGLAVVTNPMPPDAWGRRIRIDLARSPVFELHRSSAIHTGVGTGVGAAKIMRGRIQVFDGDLVAAGDAIEDGLVACAKDAVVLDWFHSIQRFIRKRYVGTIPPGPFMVGPHAAVLAGLGAELSECGFRYRPASTPDQ